MDEEVSNLKAGDSLPDTDKVYRIVIDSNRDRHNKFIPATRCFSLSDADKAQGFKLSVDWNKKTTSEQSIPRIGASHKPGTSEFKDYTKREMYAIDINFW